jgi:prepilin-type N-terminal cleavage/methylation domain-containing protein
MISPLKSNDAFTLIELIVVMTIMAILATAAFMDYGMSVKKARLDISTDQMVTMLEDAQVRTRTNYGEESNCWGLYVAAGDEPYLVLVPWENDQCQISLVEVERSLEWNSSVAIADVQKRESGALAFTSVDELTFLFYPPNADMLVYDDTGLYPDLIEASVQVSLDTSADEVLNKTLTISPTTSSFVVTSGTGS